MSEMEKIPAKEIAAFEAQLRNWNKLADVNPIITEIQRRAGTFTVSDGNLKFWREAWVGRSCAYLSHAKRFRLGEDPPDFMLDYGDHVRKFEIVDLYPAEMRIRGEYKGYAQSLNTTGSVKLLTKSFEQRRSENESIAEDLEREIKRKVAKNYDPSTILVVDVFHDFIIEVDSGTRMAAATVARRYLESFSEIWIRSGNAIVRTTPSYSSLVQSNRPSED